jgi:hypothetical protein
MGGSVAICGRALSLNWLNLQAIKISIVETEKAIAALNQTGKRKW